MTLKKRLLGIYILLCIVPVMALLGGVGKSAAWIAGRTERLFDRLFDHAMGLKNYIEDRSEA